MRINDVILMQYVDGMLSKQEAKEVELAIKKNLKLQEKINSFKEVDKILDEEYKPIYNRPIPSNFKKKISTQSGKKDLRLIFITFLKRPVVISLATLSIFAAVFYQPIQSVITNNIKEPSVLFLKARKSTKLPIFVGETYKIEVESYENEYIKNTSINQLNKEHHIIAEEQWNENFRWTVTPSGGKVVSINQTN